MIRLTMEPFCSQYQVMVLSATAYVASLSGIILMYIWYVPSLSCSLNILFITLTLVLLQLMILTSMHRMVSSVIYSTNVMLFYPQHSEPQTEICNKKAEVATSADWLTIVFKKTEAESEDDVPYGYGFFHFVFAMGAMYFAMLFVGWNAHNTMQK
ncbi:hypothetical protein GW17_00017975 [Ensete ventricosum]|nr:hypothetical protein GW17_00017975 [Ensete ventricosum]